MTKHAPRSNIRNVPQPDFSWAISLLLAHLLCYGLMIAAAMSGGAMMIYTILLFPFYIGLGAGALGLMAGKLKRWHLASLPENEEPTGPTPAEREIREIVRVLKLFLGLLGVVSAVLFLAMEEGLFMLTLPPLISLAIAWFTLTGVVTRKGISRNEALHRSATWNEMPRIRAQRVQTHNKFETFKRVAIWVGPILLLHAVIAKIDPDSLFLDPLKLLVLAVIIVAGFWPNSNLPRNEPEPLAGLAKKFRMPRRRF